MQKNNINLLMKKIEKRKSGCWEWSGGVNHKGYGRVSWDGKPSYVHRVFYEQLISLIPAGLFIDHLCRNRLCCNPAHMEPVTAAVNSLRGDGPMAENKRKTKCIHGHSFTKESTRSRLRNGKVYRECIPCHKRRSAEAGKRRKARRKARREE